MDNLEIIRNKAIELIARAARDANQAIIYMAAAPNSAVHCFNESQEKELLKRSAQTLREVVEFLEQARQKNHQELKKFVES